MAVESIFRKFWLRASFLMLISGWLTACSEQPPDDERTDPPPAQTAGTVDPGEAIPPITAAPTTGLSPERMAQWSRNCALCHVRGEGGAPVLGDRAAWAERWAQGEDLLLEHTVAGLNNMPPLGYCMDCEEEDFLALIRFMGGNR